MPLTFQQVQGPQRQDAYSIRFQVFVDEQGIDKALEIDSIDDHPQCQHYVGYQDGLPIVTCRLFPYDPTLHSLSDTSLEWCKLGRLAVVKACRGYGYGLEMMHFVLQEAHRQGYQRMLLHAQVQAKGFYEKLGFHPIGKEFDEDGVPHIQYQKLLGNE